MEVEQSWPSAKKMMADITFIKKLIEYDGDSISPSCRTALYALVRDPRLSPIMITRQSVAAAGLCRWAHALAAYDKALQVLRPKREALLAATPWWRRALLPRPDGRKVAPAKEKTPFEAFIARRSAKGSSINRLALGKPPTGGNEAPFPLTRSFIHDERFLALAGAPPDPERTTATRLYCLPTTYASVAKREDKEWLLEPQVALGTTLASELRAHLPDGYGTGGGLDTALPPSGIAWTDRREADVVKADTPTEKQLAVLAARARKYAATDGVLPEAVRARKLARLAKRVGNGLLCAPKQPAAPPAAYFETGLCT